VAGKRKNMLIDNPDEMQSELEAVEKQKLESTVEPMSNDIPDKYRGKELSDIVKDAPRG
jgi:hypothetical protein